MPAIYNVFELSHLTKIVKYFTWPVGPPARVILYRVHRVFSKKLTENRSGITRMKEIFQLCYRAHWIST